MTATIAIIRRELGAYFNTPIAYVFICFFLVLTCVLFTKGLLKSERADMRNFFELMPLFMLFFVAAISMRLWSEERKLGTMELLMTMPVTTAQAVLAKFLGGLLFI